MNLEVAFGSQSSLSCLSN